MAETVIKREGQSVVTIGDFASTLRRRWVIVVVAVLIGLAASAALYLHATKHYAATATVDITPSPASGIDPKTISSATETKVIPSGKVAALAARRLHTTTTPDDLATQVSVSAPINSLVLDITFTASSPADAVAGANAFANAYLAFRADSARTELAQQTKRLDKRLAPLISKLNSLPSTSTQRLGLQTQIASVQSDLNTISSSAVSTGQVIGTAVTPTSPSSPNPLIYFAGGFVVGLIVGIAVAAARDRRDDSVRSPSDLEESLGEPVLAVVPIARRSRRKSSALRILTNPQSTEADAYRTLALKLVPAPGGKKPGAVRVITLVGEDFGGQAPANLAVTFARQGLRTALAGTTGAANRASDLLPIEVNGADTGIVSVGSSRKDGRQRFAVLRLSDEVDLDSTLHSDPGLLGSLRDSADVIVLDGINVEHTASALSLARQADVSVLVARDGASDRSRLQNTVRELDQVDARIVGTVLFTRANAKKANAKKRSRTQKLDQTHRHPSHAPATPSDDGARTDARTDQQSPAADSPDAPPEQSKPTGQIGPSSTTSGSRR